MPLPHPRQSTRTATLVVLLTLIAAACGGGDSFTVSSDPTPVPTQTPEQEQPTDVPAPTPEPTATTAPDPVDVTEFCFAATKVGEAGEILELVDVESPAQFEFGLTRMQDALVAASDLAPTPAIQAVVDDADALVDQLIRLLEVVDYDLANAEQETLDAFVELGESGEATLDQLETDLSALVEDDCGIPLSQITANAEDAFNLFFPDGEDPPPTPIPPPPETTPPVVDGALTLADDTGIIQVTVPEAWSDTVTEFPVDGVTRFIAAEIVQGYEESWEIPGVSIAYVSGLGPLTDTEVLEQAQAFEQCLLLDTNPYSDPLYTGTIQTYEQCGQSGTNAAVLVARSAQFGDDFVLVEVQYPPNDTVSLDLVLSSFIVTP